MNGSSPSTEARETSPLTVHTTEASSAGLLTMPSRLSSAARWSTSTPPTKTCDTPMIRSRSARSAGGSPAAIEWATAVSCRSKDPSGLRSPVPHCGCRASITFQEI
ncbi:hypothetical protein G7085_16685 [Tessaracoccus sp. HDW20]|nr:hypothetical protein [Tessaracoccus coleopterorum]